MFGVQHKGGSHAEAVERNPSVQTPEAMHTGQHLTRMFKGNILTLDWWLTRFLMLQKHDGIRYKFSQAYHRTVPIEEFHELGILKYVGQNVKL